MTFFFLFNHPTNLISYHLTHSENDWVNLFPFCFYLCRKWFSWLYISVWVLLQALKEFSQLPPPLGLKITMTPEMLQSTRTSQVAANNKVEKLKAVQFPMNMLKIGYFKVRNIHNRSNIECWTNAVRISFKGKKYIIQPSFKD